ncbi:MAG: hypothetical protein HRF51_12100 [bacterium]
MRTGTIIAVLLLGTAISLAAQNLGGNLYSSRDELFEEYLKGDIDYQTYQNLLEILESGIDSTNQFLLEELADFGYFLTDDPTIFTPMETEQIEAARRPEAMHFLRLRRYQELAEEGDAENRFYLRSSFHPDWKVLVRGEDDYTSEPIFNERSLVMKSDDGPIHRMTIGNFTARFGLGLTVGYRGGLFSRTDNSAEETILVPKFRGFNGIYLEGGRRNETARWLFHYDRNARHRLSATAISLERNLKRFRFEAIALGAVLKNRTLDENYYHYQYGFYFNYKYRTNEISLEAASQKESKTVVPAVVLESKFKDAPTALRLAVWKYDDDFINIMGGSRAGPASQTVEIDEIDFSFSDRRNNQAGFLLRGDTRFGRRWRHNISLQRFGGDRFSSQGRLSSYLERELSTATSIRLYFFHNSYDEIIGAPSSSETRMEFQYKLDDVFLRTYFGYSRDRTEKEFLSYFIKARKNLAQFGQVEVWLNLDRFNLNTGQTDYLYGYIMETVSLNPNFDMSAKYTYRYSRGADDKNRHSAFLEGQMRW